MHGGNPGMLFSLLYNKIYTYDVGSVYPFNYTIESIGLETAWLWDSSISGEKVAKFLFKEYNLRWQHATLADMQILSHCMMGSYLVQKLIGSFISCEYTERVDKL